MNDILQIINSMEWVRGLKKERLNDMNDLLGERLFQTI